MISNQTQQRKKIRLALLLVGILGLAFSAIFYFVSQSSKRQSLAESTKTTNNEALAVSPEKTTTLQVVQDKLDEKIPVYLSEISPAEKPAPRTQKKHKFHSAQNKIAYTPPKFPKNLSPDWTTPEAEVEMWSGAKKSIVFVPPGPKFED